MTVSSEVIGGRQESLCAHMERLKQPINLTVALQVNLATTILLEELAAQPFYRCIRFEVRMQKFIFFLCFIHVHFSDAKVVKRLVATSLAGCILI